MKYLLILLLFISCKPAKEEGKAEAVSSNEGMKSIPIVEEDPLVGLVNGEYLAVCENTSGSTSEGYKLGIGDNELIIYHTTYWRVDCEFGAESDRIYVRLDRASRAYLDTTFSSRWADNYYNLCGLTDTNTGVPYSINNTGCYLSWEDKDTEIFGDSEEGYIINGIEFNTP